MNEKGFTLVEAIIAIVVVGIIAVIFIPLLTSQYVNIQKTGDQSDATYDAVEITEDGISKVKNNEPVIDPADPNPPDINVTRGVDKVEMDLKGTIGSVEIPVDTVTVKGNDRKKGEESEIIVGVPR